MVYKTTTLIDSIITVVDNFRDIARIFSLRMDFNLETISHYISQKEIHFKQFNCDTLCDMLDLTDKVNIENKKDELFLERLGYIAMALTFKSNMVFGSGIKQVKTYLKSVLLMNDDEAQKKADKINLGCCIASKLPQIITNCEKCGVDIRSLSFKELSLAKNVSWVINKKTLSSFRKKVPVDAPVHVENAREKLLRSFDLLRQESGWYEEIKKHPSLVSKWMRDLMDLMVKDSLFEASIPDE